MQCYRPLCEKTHFADMEQTTICARKNRSFQEYLATITRPSNNDTFAQRRHKLDKILRHVVFNHYERFSELAGSTLVKS